MTVTMQVSRRLGCPTVRRSPGSRRNAAMVNTFARVLITAAVGAS
jgi:hypothetical protein